MSVRDIVQAFQKWRTGGEAMVLATVYDTIGSTYSKAGHRILIAANGDYQGLVSGGCLEGDLAERSREVIKTMQPQAVTYDMRDEADDLWGLGVGCNGLIRVFLQPLEPAEGYEPFASIAEHLLENHAAAVATVIEGEGEGLVPGSTLIWRPDSHRSWRLDEAAARRLFGGCERVLAEGRASLQSDGKARILFAPLKPVPRLLVLGAGLDAIPLINMAADLGWLVSVADHRPAYLERSDFSRAERAVLTDPRSLGETFELGSFDAVVIMSHNLVADRNYLEQLANVDLRYVGVLGPRARTERLLKQLDEAGVKLRAKVRGPVGLDLGADSPESIALSVLAEVHAVLAGGTGRTLTHA